MNEDRLHDSPVGAAERVGGAGVDPIRLRGLVVASAPAGQGSTVPAPPLLRMLLMLPAMVVRFYLHWILRARLLGRRGDMADRARRWSRWERRRPVTTADAVMAQIDYRAQLLMWKRWPLRTAIGMLTLPFSTGVRALRTAARLGGAVRATHSRSIPAQALEIWLLALRHPLSFASDASLYYLNQVYEPARRGDAPFLFSNLHHVVLSSVINGGPGAYIRKGAFERHCAQFGLPHVPILAEVAPNGEIAWSGAAAGLPADDLFSKPGDGSHGDGAARWLLQPDGRYRAESGALLDAPAVLEELRRAARGGRLIVQRRVRNHPEVEALVGSTLATARIVSLRMPDDTVEFVLAMHRSSPRDAAVDNTAQGGVVCPIDMPSGVLGDVVSIEDNGIRFGPVHPRTGERVSGARLPFWPETLSLVERAHRLFDRHRLVGWDVALTAEGPVLLEANSVPGAQGLQAAHRTPLGRSRYAELLLGLIESAERNVRPEALAR